MSCKHTSILIDESTEVIYRTCVDDGEVTGQGYERNTDQPTGYVVVTCQYCGEGVEGNIEDHADTWPEWVTDALFAAHIV